MFRIFLIAALLGAPSYAFAQGVDLVADEMVRGANGVVTATGDVELKRQDEMLKADKLTYDANNKTMQATGHVDISSPKAHITGTSATLNTDDKTGEIQQAYITLPQGERIQADSLQRLSEMHFNGDNISFTTCPPDAEAWRLHASHADIDQDAGVLTARDARFEIAGAPVFYTPYWQHPLRRKSGLLIPSFGSSNSRGSEYALPYYWAPATNWDATLTPRWMTARGFMGDVEVRHTSSQGHETVQWAAIRDTQTNTSRQHVQGDIAHRLPANWQFNSQINYVSDHDFISDFNPDGSAASTRYLQNTAALTWANANADINLNGQYQQNLAVINDDSTLQILPRLESHYALPVSILNSQARLHLDQQTTRFDRRIGNDGWRLSVRPWLEIPMQFEQGAITSNLKIGARHLRYWQLNTPANGDQRTRTAYDTSLETRMNFERISDNRTWRHAISPIVRYDLAWTPTQTGLLNFDSGFSQLTLNNLMQGNRFTGLDRFERMNRVSFMLENSIQHKDDSRSPARTILNTRAGVAYDFIRQNVDTALQTNTTRPYSNLVGDMSISPMAGITVSAAGQYDPSDKFWATAELGLDLQHSQGHQFNVRWQQVDARYSIATDIITSNARIQLTPRWQVLGSMQYDRALKLTQQASAGVHYQHSCWDFTVEGYRTLNTGTSRSANLGYQFLLGFKGLGSLGDS